MRGEIKDFAEACAVVIVAVVLLWFSYEIGRHNALSWCLAETTTQSVLGGTP